MELIPILSLIILVATISTFILAVGAYILYKIRERKGRTSAAQRPDSIEAELITPSRIVAETNTPRTAVTGEQIYTRNIRSESAYTSERSPQMRPTFVAPRETRATRTHISRYTAPITQESNEPEKYTSSQKFKRYNTSYDTKPEEKKEDSLKWR